MVNWPCLLKLSGDDELSYLNDEPDFIFQCQGLIYCDDDYIIDSKGFCYQIGVNIIAKKQQDILVKQDRILTAEEVTHLIKLHEFSKAELCLSKIYFADIAQAIKAIATHK